MDHIEQELRRILQTTPAEYSDEAVVSFVKEKLLESYKNGIQAGTQGTPYPRNRRPAAPRQAKP
jgi:hypothetical protein